MARAFDQSLLEERLRMRALSRYFTPAQITADIIRASSDRPVPPTLANNTQLTILAQSGALKLRCDRAFISLLGTDTQYVVAEATKSISLRQTNRYATPQDALLLGVQAIDKSYGVCPNTISIFTDATGNLALDSPQVLANTTKYIIRDFRELDDFKDRPYVVGFPHMRSYAEVPLRTFDGRVVGSFCVVDNTVRDDFFEDETAFVLEETADSIMEYLDVAAAKHNHARGERLMQGLACFTEGRSSLGIKSDAQLIRQAQIYAGRLSDVPDATECVSPMYTSDTESFFDRDSGFTTNQTSNSSVSSLHKPVGPRSDSSSVFSQAASIICEALELEGVVLIDSSMPVNNSMFQASGVGSKPTGSSSQAVASAPVIETAGAGVAEGAVSAALCQVLGLSVAAPPGNPYASPSSPLVRSSSLHLLAQTYPEGQIFSIDEHGVFPVDVILRRGSTSSQFSERNGFDSETLPRELQTEFADACCIIFKPLWDFSKETMVAGIVGWTTDPTRFLDMKDLTCLDAFGHALMTEVARSEAVYIASAKSAFISSISHELRSPLHGILASAELLHRAVEEEGEKDLVRMLENCGNTLLDTLNHLLDYSKINGFETAKTLPRLSADQSDHGQATEVLLCQLVQDVVESVYFGQGFALALENKHDPSEGSSRTSISHFPSVGASEAVGVFVDIEQRLDWCMPLHVGAWKRIVMNLFANAMKYTENGHIAVTLDMVPAEDREGRTRKHVRLVVSDSGVGMAQNFLDRHIYKPFVQEDSLRPGTGLGLSIVKHIVNDMGGTIDVQSLQGRGSTFTVSVPTLDLPLSSAAEENSGRHVLDPNGALEGRRLCVVPSLEPSDAVSAAEDGNRFSAMKSTVSRICRDWFGMVVVSASSLDRAADFYVIDGPTFVDGYRSVLSRPKDRSTGAIVSIGSISESHGVKGDGSVTQMPYPITPRLLAKALLAASKGAADEFQGDHTSSLMARSTPDVFTDGAKTAAAVPPPSGQPLDRSQDGKAERGSLKHLLLVDDNPINLKVLSVSVKKLGCTWETASNGREAVDMYQSSKKRFDVVFMDLSMPVLDGFGASSAIRDYEKTSAGHRWRPTRIIALTGLGARSAKQEAHASGIDEFHTKPIKLKDIERLVDGS